MAFSRKPPPGNVRRVVSLDGNCRGVTTNKCGRLIQFESELERILVLLLERDPSVADFISQPLTIPFTAPDGRARHYTPDFQVWYTDGRVALHEVTLVVRRQAHPPQPLRELAAHAFCQQRGWEFVIHTDQTLPSGAHYTNLDVLSAFRATSHVDAARAAWWHSHLAGRGAVSPRSSSPQTLPVPLLAPCSTPSTISSGTARSRWTGRCPCSGAAPSTPPHRCGPPHL
ncbi:MAG: TnsA endonuclease N-terminal domain-containing protein [Chloroflexales bacterium]